MDITMSTFKEYLSESVKTYEFKIKIAGDLPEGFDKAMKTALMKYDCASINAREEEIIEDNLEGLNRIGTSTEAILNKPYETESAQDQVGDKKVLNFLKELGKISHKGDQVKGVNDAILANSSPEEKNADPFKGQKK